jgi:two-component sensor histidine kinase
MVAVGEFPFPDEEVLSAGGPRVGDGVLLVDATGRVTFASPNAVSALRRLGVSGAILGELASNLGTAGDGVFRSFLSRRPAIEDVEHGEPTVVSRCIPLLAAGRVDGAVVLLRDVSELRSRDRALISKDATIREIHHRVKNNLQTISSLLRLQSRRLTNPEAKAAVQESVRRIRTIALVHESLSREPGEDVAFIEIVRPLLRLAEEGLQSPDRPVRFTVSGDGGRIPANTATPLSVVLTELLQNAVDHGFPEGSGGGDVQVGLSQVDRNLTIRVVDNGRGVDPTFDIDQAKGLGLSIVRTLVTTELNGTIDIRPATSDDLASAGFGDGYNRQHGTVIELCVPTDD